MPPVRMDFAWCVDRIVYAPHAASDTATRRYVCIECKGGLDLRRTTVKAHGGRYNVPAYFAHERKSSTCTGASGESLQHLKSKYMLQKFLGHYDFCLECCEECQDCLGFVTKKSDKVALEERVVLGEKIYVYDVLISRRGRAAVAVEVFHTHKTEESKIEISGKYGIHVVEVRSSDVLGAEPRLDAALLNGGSITLPNVLKKTLVCTACQTLIVYSEQADDAFEDWVRTSCALELEYLRHLTAVTLAMLSELKRQVNATRLRGLKRKAFEKARVLSDNFEEEHRSRKSKAYRPGSSFKCCGCGVWGTSRRRISRSKFFEYQYGKIQNWYVSKGLTSPDYAEACDLCTMKCPGCGDDYLLEYACKYGLCLECNLASHYTPGSSADLVRDAT